jgi:hypothetical protein
VSVFRPSARVRSPDGRDWELYVYRFELRDRTRSDAAHSGEPVRLVVRLVSPLVRATTAVARALRTDDWTVEAITFMPQRQSYVWRTSKEHRGQVLAQVEGSLVRGDVPQHLRHAVYDGWSRSAR